MMRCATLAIVMAALTAAAAPAQEPVATDAPSTRPARPQAGG